MEMGAATGFGTATDACGLHQDGTLECGAGNVPPLQLLQMDSPWPSGTVHMGCGLTFEGNAICWGGAGMVVPVPPGVFKRIEVSTSGEGVCGFNQDDTVECWIYQYVAADPFAATNLP